MNLFKSYINKSKHTDEHLVTLSLGGDKDAFCQIVVRYQNLLCSIAYASLGDFKQSEDVAQEAFVEAWKKLASIREPEKLKAWLCGILRFKLSHYHRKEQHQVISGASEIEMHDKVAEGDLEHQVIDEQHQTLLWQLLENLGDNYKEPLVLYYRENQSIDKVAHELSLSKDTVKQRLSRGRALLKTAMADFVENTLKNTKPGEAFTTSVMVMISDIAPTLKSTAIGTSAAKASYWFKLTSVVTFIAAISGLISSYFGLQASLAQSRTLRERQLTKKVVSLFLLVAALYVFGMLVLRKVAYLHQSFVDVYAILSQLLVLSFVLIYCLLVKKAFSALQKLRIEERLFQPEAFDKAIDHAGAKSRYYKSAWSLFGVPLVHVHFGLHEKNDKPTFGWVAGGTYAHGLIFAWGGVAIAPISVGILSVGVVSIGAVGLGVFSLGTVALGGIGLGASAVAYKAYGSLSAMGWHSALSDGFSIAKQGAIGRIAYAAQANNEAAATLVELTSFNSIYPWALLACSIMVIVPAIWYANKVKQHHA